MRDGEFFNTQKPSVLNLGGDTDIFVQGEAADCFYVLLSGQADLLRGEQKVMQLGSGTVLGTETLFRPDKGYLYTARTRGEARVARHGYQEFLDQAMSGPRLLRRVLDTHIREIEELWLRMEAAFKENQDYYFPGGIKSCAPGEWVIREGDRDDAIYRIVSSDQGLEVVKQDKVLALLREPGDFFGEMAAILGEARTAGVRSVGESVLEVYPGDRLNQMIADYPGMSARIISNLAQRLASTSRELACDSQDT
ncbi:cyclic nucleotide-binding domain-containing protein [Desulfonatronospira sp. MSAO_Bac3]|uniref:cyclic nucleotide-binding domain-containing protein n=1 Tax=Desulfonatronospira sp. MSAO_Bac3 TaxID=2293857 RepID=UPI000FED71CA|nr:cyclic nucleotide-binding domain-containing protein [Desulfonatronospira sp. MSAO_Bac3]RQD77078.1 MAG: cyclic nucleotide-binding domain-containing protein [Desulfonatronospira sp. MSAO_Bac3]